MRSLLSRTTRAAPSLHDRIRSDIEGMILSGAWLPGFRIPYEHELMTRYDCSRMTVNKALATLVEKGLLDRRKRAGTFVASPGVHRAAIDIPDIRSDIIASGRRYAFELVAREERAADAADRAALAIEAGAVLALTCVHHADGASQVLEQRRINLSLVPQARGIDFAVEPPGSWLLAHIPWGAARHRIAALAADGEVARLLGVAPGHACLSVERWTWQSPERITHVRQIYADADYGLEAHFRSAGDFG